MKTTGARPCFACGRDLMTSALLVDTRDDQLVWVGPDCYQKIVRASNLGLGWKPPLGGPLLYVITEERKQILKAKGIPV